MVVLAQLAEHRIVVPSVVGSNPTFHPEYLPCNRWASIFFRIEQSQPLIGDGLNSIFQYVKEHFAFLSRYGGNIFCQDKA